MGVLRYFFSFKGRINRAKYLLWAIFLFALQYAFKYIEWYPAAVFGDTSLAKAFTRAEGGISPAALWVFVVLAWPTVAITLKRLHDRDKGMLWIFLYWLGPSVLTIVAGATAPGDAPMTAGTGLVPLACLVGAGLLNLMAIVDLGFTLGTDGDNRFGPDPLLPPEINYCSAENPVKGCIPRLEG